MTSTMLIAESLIKLLDQTILEYNKYDRVLRHSTID